MGVYDDGGFTFACFGDSSVVMCELYITDLRQRGQLIPEQNANDTHPLVRLALSPSTNPRKAQPVE
jgi:hypothetical protein